MSDDPMAAALARLHAEHPDLPTDGGRVWEPVQDDGEDAEAPTPLELAEQPAPADRAAILREAANALACLGPEDSLVSGPKAWNEAIEVLRRMANEAQQAEQCGRCSHGKPAHNISGCIECPGGWRADHRFGPTDEAQQPAPADACQFHSTTGSPCDCGCDAGADCHPKES